MPELDDTVEVTELIEIDPSRVDAVSSPANGTEWLILKAVGDEIAEMEVNVEDVVTALIKADEPDDDRPDCTTCKGDGKIMDGHRKCPKCLGSGKQPKVGDSAKASAPSGVTVPARKDCPTCNGSGTLASNTSIGAETETTETTCPDCDGTGNNAQTEDELHRVQADNGTITEGDPKGRETIDKAVCDCAACYYLTKSEMSGAAINDLPDSAFAHIEPGGKKDSEGKTTPRSLRHFPIHDKAHAKNALARLSTSPFGAAAKSKVVAAAKKFGVEVSAKSTTISTVIEKDGVISGPNPLNGSMSGADSDSTPAPGSPEWEATDAAIATAAAQALMQASELIQQFAGREAIEVAAGEGNDLFDTWDASCALDAVTAALGIIARLAFHEGVAAQKATDEVVEKRGKRLSTKSVTALAAARDHLSQLLGDDDPAKAESDDDADDDNGDKAEKDVLDMNPDELQQLVATTVAQAVVAATAELNKSTAEADDDAEDLEKVKAGKAPVDDEKDAVASGKSANSNAKGKAPKAENDSLEDEADQGTNDSASSPAKGAAKATDADATDDAEPVELTPEQIEARKQVKEAKKALKAAKRTEEEAAKQVELAKALKEEVEKDREIIASLTQRTEERLAQVEKMAAPGGPAKTRTQEQVNKAAEHDATDLELAKFEKLARDTTEPELRRGYTQAAKELRVKLAEANKS